MSETDIPLLDRINRLLADHPATEKQCGEKRTRLRREDGRLIAEVSYSKCAQVDRFEAEISALDPGHLDTDLVPKHNRGQVFIPCRGDKPCARWTIRDEGTREWRQAREDPELAVDCAPNAAVVAELKELLARWLGKADSK